MQCFCLPKRRHLEAQVIAAAHITLREEDVAQPGDGHGEQG